MKNIISLSLPGDNSWTALLNEPFRSALEDLLPAFLQNCRWFGGKARTISAARLTDIKVLPGESGRTRLVTIEVLYDDGLEEDYFFPLSFRFTDRNSASDDISSSLILARVRIGSREGIIYDATGDPAFREACFNFIGYEREIQGEEGELRGRTGRYLRDWIESEAPVPKSRLLRKEQSNTSFIFGDEYILKLYRRLINGVNPEVEIIRFLSKVTRFPHIAHFAGLIEECRPGSPPVTLALLQRYVEHDSDGWTYFLDAARRCFAGNGANPAEVSSAGLQSRPTEAPSRRGTMSIGPSVCRMFYNRIGKKYRDEVKLLGKRTARLHQALASDPVNPDFSPEPYSLSDRQKQLQSSLSLLEETLHSLKNTEKNLPPKIREEAGRLRGRKTALIDRLRQITDLSSPGLKIRIHGDYHLGQILHTKDDFVIIDFEGEPARSIAERRRKRPPLIDVAGMIRSFHYTAYGAIFLEGTHSPEIIADLSSRAEDWCRIMSDTFLESYLNAMDNGLVELLPSDREMLDRMLDFFLLDKTIYELNYELNNRPEWLIIPLRGIIHENS